MKPSTSIPPKTIIRRQDAKRWHLMRDQSYPYYGTECGQSIRYAVEATAYDATQITCTDCLRAAIGRHAERGGAER